MNGHVDCVRFLIQKGADPTLIDELGWIPLHCAAFKGYSDCFKELLQVNGDHKNMQDIAGDTPAHLAAAEDRVEILEILAQKEADFRIINDREETPYDVALRLEKEAAIRFFEQVLNEKKIQPDLTESQDKNSSSTNISSENLENNPQDSQIMDENQSKPSLTSKFSQSEFPLHEASIEGNVAEIEYWLKNPDASFWLNSQNGEGNTALHLAVIHQQIEAARKLLESQANVWVKNSAGKTAAQMAFQNGNKDMISLFQQFHPEINHDSFPAHPKDDQAENSNAGSAQDQERIQNLISEMEAQLNLEKIKREELQKEWESNQREQEELSNHLRKTNQELENELIALKQRMSLNYFSPNQESVKKSSSKKGKPKPVRKRKITGKGVIFVK
eukprot:Sdes_comp15577_c0_seq1m4557